MRLLCCIKVVADFDLPANHQWEIVQDDVDFSFYRKIINGYDASCVELALQAKATCGQDVAVTALTLADATIERFLKPLFAIGVERCVRIHSEGDLRFVPQWVAAELAQWVAQNPQDYILLGTRQSVGQNAAVGPLLASQLGYRCYTGVTAFTPGPDGQMTLTLRVDKAQLTVLATAPAVLVLDDSVTTLLHTPTIKEKLAASGCQLEQAPATAPQQLLPPAVALAEEHHEKACRMLSLDEATRFILQSCGKEGPL